MSGPIVMLYPPVKPCVANRTSNCWLAESATALIDVTAIEPLGPVKLTISAAVNEVGSRIRSKTNRMPLTGAPTAPEGALDTTAGATSDAAAGRQNPTRSGKKGANDFRCTPEHTIRAITSITAVGNIFYRLESPTSRFSDLHYSTPLCYSQLRGVAHCDSFNSFLPGQEALITVVLNFP